MMARLLNALFACSLAACAVEPRASTVSHPTAGLYTPGSPLGVSDPSDVPMPGASLGNRCVSLANAPQAGAGGAAATATGGELALTYRTQSTAGRYAPRNCSAVWIETADDRFVATLEISAALRRPGLVYLQDHACLETPGPDVVTSATKRDHERPHMVKWSGVDFESRPAADGTYKLFIEVTESDKEPGEFQSFDFVKGPTAFSMELPVVFEGPLAEATLSWTPDAPAGAAP